MPRKNISKRRGGGLFDYFKDISLVSEIENIQDIFRFVTDYLLYEDDNMYKNYDGTLYFLLIQLISYYDYSFTNNKGTEKKEDFSLKFDTFDESYNIIINDFLKNIFYKLKDTGIEKEIRSDFDFNKLNKLNKLNLILLFFIILKKNKIETNDELFLNKLIECLNSIQIINQDQDKDDDKINNFNKLLNELLLSIYKYNLNNLLLKIRILSPDERFLVAKLIEYIKIEKRVKGDDWYGGGKSRIKKVIRKY